MDFRTDWNIHPDQSLAIERGETTYFIGFLDDLEGH